MAAGFSKRMGCQKLLLPYGPQSLLRHVVKKGLNTTASEAVVVLNSQFEDLFSEISDLPIWVIDPLTVDLCCWQTSRESSQPS